jgi:hypothetical protein
MAVRCGQAASIIAKRASLMVMADIENGRGNLLSSIQDKTPETGTAQEPEPFVGMFYVVEDKLYWEGTPCSRAKKTGYVAVHPNDFATFWKEYVVAQSPHLIIYDESHFPRGRVVYSIQEGIYRVRMDKCIFEDRRLVERILSEMKLPESGVKLLRDSEYECRQCKNGKTGGGTFVDSASAEIVYTTEDGRKLFFPWRTFFPSSHSGYVVSSQAEYKSIRRGAAICTVLILMVTLFGGRLCSIFARALTGSESVGALTYFATILAVVIPSGLWLRTKCRGLKKTWD